MNQMNKNTPYPIQNIPHNAIILINSAHLPSSIFDGANLVKLFTQVIPTNSISILTDTLDTAKKISERISKILPSSPGNLTYKTCKTASELLNTYTQLIKQLKGPNSLTLCVSSHGHASGSNNYIIFNGQKITDNDLNKAISSEMSQETNCLVIVDACQSGTEINLNYYTTDLKKYARENPSNSTKSIVSISAVSDNEYVMDDISAYGFGGGLTSGFIDYYVEKKYLASNLTIGGFYKYYCTRIKPTGNHSILSFNNLDFIQ